MNNLIIGIDFDNTIVQYDALFVSLANAMYARDFADDYTKKQVRDALRLLPDGEAKWIRLQKEVYGQQIMQALPVEGVQDALQNFKKAGAELNIISHRTADLQEAAGNWLRAKGVAGELVAEDCIFFNTTREAKIEKVIQQQCDVFIDDLVEVFDEPMFPAGVTKILFSKFPPENPVNIDYTFGHWRKIEEFLRNEFFG